MIVLRNNKLCGQTKTESALVITLIALLLLGIMGGLTMKARNIFVDVNTSVVSTNASVSVSSSPPPANPQPEKDKEKKEKKEK